MLFLQAASISVGAQRRIEGGGGQIKGNLTPFKKGISVDIFENLLDMPKVRGRCSQNHTILIGANFLFQNLPLPYDYLSYAPVKARNTVCVSYCSFIIHDIYQCFGSLQVDGNPNTEGKNKIVPAQGNQNYNS